MRRLLFIGALLALAAGCRPPVPEQKTYELRGQVLRIRPDVREISISHEEIPGYMAAMSMSFGVKDVGLLKGLERGDLVRGTLVVTDTDAWLSALEKTGHEPVKEPDEERGSAAGTPAASPPELLQPGQPVPDATFTDQEGRRFSLSSARGRAVALTFVYTRCPLPNFCPRMDRNFLAAQKALSNRPALKDKVLLLSVSFDPAFDTPAVMKQHAASVGADTSWWWWLTADTTTVDAFATRFGVSVIREGTNPGEITHNLRTAVIAPDGRLDKIFSGNEWTPDELVSEIAKVAATS